jgi:hypothetical protein
VPLPPLGFEKQPLPAELPAEEVGAHSSSLSRQLSLFPKPPSQPPKKAGETAKSQTREKAKSKTGRKIRFGPDEKTLRGKSDTRAKPARRRKSPAPEATTSPSTTGESTTSGNSTSTAPIRFAESPSPESMARKKMEMSFEEQLFGDDPQEKNW